jgi:hypothetical protein
MSLLLFTREESCERSHLKSSAQPSKFGFIKQPGQFSRARNWRNCWADTNQLSERLTSATELTWAIALVAVPHDPSFPPSHRLTAVGRIVRRVDTTAAKLENATMTQQPSKNTAVKQSPLNGKGLFALRSFRKGAIVEPLEGEIVWRKSSSKYAIAIDHSRSLILAGKCKYVNAAYGLQGNVPNVRFSLKRAALIAMRDVAAGEELLAEYTNSLF